MLLTSTRYGPGEAPSAVLVHGITGSSDSWPVVATHLVGRGFGVVAPDLRGHGCSPGPADGYALDDHVGDLVDTVGSTVDVLIGHSLGGTLAVRAIASGAITARVTILEDPVLSLSQEQATTVVDTELAYDPRELAALASSQPHWTTTEVLAKALALTRLDPEAVRATFVGNSPWDVEADVTTAARRCRLAVVLPDASPYVDDEQAARLEHALGAASVHRVAGSGHSIHRDRPREFLDLVDTFTDDGPQR